MTQQIGIRINWDGSAGESGAKRFSNTLQGMRADVANIDRSAEAATASLARMGHAATAALSIREIVQAADGYAQLNATLNIATGSVLAGMQAYAETRRIALATGQTLSDVATIYRRFADNATALGLTQAQVSAATETVAKAIALSGGSAESSQAALVQFGQALASGVLRGEEFNSVMEQAPRLAKALADGMNVPVGKLRELAEQGRITSDEIVQALQNQASKLDDEFGKLPVTISRALTNVKTAWIDTVGSFEKSTGVFSVAAQGLDVVAHNMDAVAAASGAVAAVLLGKTVAGMVTATQAKIANAAAARALAAAELQEAEAAAASAAAKAAQASLMASNTAATNALTAANTRLAAAQAGVAATSRGAMVLGAMGNWVGLVTTALTIGATAWMLWRDKSEEATKEAARSAVQNLDSIIAKVEEMNGRLADVSRKSYEATVAAAESGLKTARAEITYLQTELEKLDSAGGKGRFSEQGKDLQTRLNAEVEREIKLQAEVGEARQRAGEVGVGAINKFIDANAVGADKVRVKQTKLLQEFAQGIAQTGGVLDLANAAHARAYKALQDGLKEAMEGGEPFKEAKAAAEARADAMVRSYQASVKRALEILKADHEQYRIPTQIYIEAKAIYESSAIEQQIAALRQKLKSATTAAEKIKINADISELQAKLAQIPVDTQAAFDAADAKTQDVLRKMAVDAGKSLDPLEQKGREFAEKWGNTMQQAAVDGNQAVIDAGNAVWQAWANEAQFQSAKQEYEALFSTLQYQLESVRIAAEKDGGVLAALQAGAKAEEIKYRLLPALEAARQKMEQFAEGSLVNEKTVTETTRTMQRVVQEANPYWKRFGEDIERGLTDSLYRGFESGKSFTENFIDSVENTFKTSALKLSVQLVVSTTGNMLNAAINALLGTSGDSGGAGTNWLGLASNASSAYNLLNGSYVTALTNAYNNYLAGTTIGGYTLTSIGAAGSGVAGSVGAGTLGGISSSGSVGLTTTGGAVGIQGSIGTGSLAAGAGEAGAGGTGSAAGAAASMWPLAVIAGMYMSGKLYDSGYKFDNSAFKTDDPKTWSMLAQYGAYNEANMVGKLWGDDNFGDSKFWQVATGANLSRYVDEYVQKALGIRGGGPKMEAYGGDRNVSWGLAQSAPTNDVLTGIATGLETQFNAVLEKFGKSAQDIVVGLGMDADPKGDASARMGYALKVGDQSIFSESDVSGLTMEAIKNNANRALLAALQAVDISEPVDKYLDSLGDVGKITSDQITQAMGMIQAYDGLNKAMDTLNLGTNSLTSGLLAAFGGVEGLQQELASYYQNFSTAEERRAHVVQQITDTLNAAGANVTTDWVANLTRVDFKNWLEGVDKTTDAGKALVTAALQIEGSVASITASMDEAAAATAAAAEAASKAAEEAAAKALQGQLSGLQSAWSAITSTSSTLADAGDTGGIASMLASLQAGYAFVADLGDRAGVLEQINGLQDQLDQKAAVAIQADIDAYQRQLDNAKALLDIAKGIHQYVAGLKVSDMSSLSPEQKLAEAASQYTIALAKARAGDQEAAGQLQGLADSYLGQARDYYGSNTAYAAIFDQVTSGLDQFADRLTAQNDPLVNRLEHQISVAQESLAVGSRTLAATQLLYTQAAAQFQTSIAQIAQQIIATDSVKSAIDSLPPELAGILSSAVAGQLSTTLSSYAHDNNLNVSSNTIDQLVSATSTGAKTVADAQAALKTIGTTNAAVGNLASGGILGWVLGSVMQSVTAGTLTGTIPGFASGGDFAGGLRIVGEKGPELEMTGPARIFSAAQTRDILSGAGTSGGTDPQVVQLLSDVLLELRDLRLQSGRANGDQRERDARIARTLDNIESSGVLARSR